MTGVADVFVVLIIVALQRSLVLHDDEKFLEGEKIPGRAKGGGLHNIARKVEHLENEKNVETEAAKEIAVVPMMDVSGGASGPLRVKMSSSRKEPLRGLAVSEMQDIAHKCSKWFPVANARDSLRKFKPQGGREVATLAVTFHNFASFLHVATALKAVDLPTDAVVWPCVSLEDEKGDSKTCTAEATLEKTTWSAAMERFDVAGERPHFIVTSAFVCFLN